MPRSSFITPLRQLLRITQQPRIRISKACLSTTTIAMVQQYKLKISLLDLKNGEKREVEIEGLDGSKVLLVKVVDKYHALSPKCTHYGAPLMKGVLTGDGRLTCPWHGACFNVATGDIENAPAPDPLAHFEIIEKDGGVYIEGDEGTIKANRRSANYSCMAEGDDQVVIVGGGSGSFGVVEGLRGGGFKGKITVISKEGYPAIDRTKLSKALIADHSKIALRTSDWYKSASVDLVGDEVKSVDFDEKKVSTASGKTFPYTKLVLASGGTPRRLPLPGFKELGNVFVLRTIPDVRHILAAVGEGKGRRIVVIGSSFIGMEVAKTLTGKGHYVYVVGMEKAPLERVMGEKVGQIFQKQLEKTGVKFFMNASVDSASPSEEDSNMVGVVNLKDGSKLPADVVILGVGVAPATEYLKENKSVKLRDDGSLVTDEYFSVEGLKDVYAIGDIATYPYHGPGGGKGALTRIEHWNVAQNAGRAVAAHIQDPSSRAKPFIPIFWSALGGQLRYCGNTMGGFDDIVLNQDSDDKFAAYYCKGDTVVALACMGVDPLMSHVSELMRRGNMPGKSEIEKGVDVLGISVPAEVTM